MSLLRNIGKIQPSSTALFLCDMQVKFRPSITHFDAIVENSNKVLAAAQHMAVPTFATEQYPKGLGPTVPEIELAKYNILPFSKTCFTMCLPELMEKFKAAQTETKSVILCGIETQACITATTLDLLEMGIDVHIPVDCVSSRSMTDRKFSLDRLRQSGAFLTTSETVILGFAPDAAHPKFKGLQKLVMEPSKDTGLLMQDVCFNILTIPGKGHGCVANRRIRRGSLLFREKALFATDCIGRELDNLSAENNLAWWDSDTIEIEKDRLEYVKVIKSFLNLNSKEKETFLQLCSGQPDRRTETAIRKAFQSFPQSEYLPYDLCYLVCSKYRVNAFNDGIFPTLSKINHSCLANTEIFWNSEQETRDLVAVTDINYGEELCHNYLHSSLAYQDRRNDLHQKWNFVCYCSFCSHGLDMELMALVDHVNQNFRSNTSAVRNLTAVLLKIEDLRLIRVLAVLGVLDKIYLHYSIDSLISSCYYCDIIEPVATIGLQYSRILVQSDGSLTRTWQYRQQHPTLFAFKRLLIEVFVFLLRVVTLVILFHSLWEVEVCQYMMLLLSSLFYSKL